MTTQSLKDLTQSHEVLEEMEIHLFCFGNWLFMADLPPQGVECVAHFPASLI
jgi:hypothetical protein